MGLVIQVAATITGDQDRILHGWAEDVYGVAGLGIVARPKERHILGFLDGRLVSHVGLVEAQARVGDAAFVVGGVGAVVTIPEAQRQGHAAMLLRHAASLMQSSWTVAAGMLFCGPTMTAYYERLGWQQVAGEVSFEQPHGRVRSPSEVMVLPLLPEGWPVGAVHIPGLPW